MKGSALRFGSTAAMPAAIRKLVEAQGNGAPREAAAKPESRPNKYHNQPTTVDGIRFDSKKEARYYEQLKIRRATGEVAYWLRQVGLHLPGGSRYVVDFVVFFTDPARAPAYVDVKGRQTQVFRLKRREIEHHYPVRIELV